MSSSSALSSSSVFPPSVSSPISGAVLVEGSIAAGKTTRCRELQERGYKVAYEKVPQVLLTQFLEEPKRNALALQAYTITKRVWVACQLRDEAKEKKTLTFQDRGPFGDSLFCITNYLVGNIDEKGMEAYIDMVHTCTEIGDILHDPSVTIAFMHVPDDVCQKRLAGREGVDQSTPSTYLTRLHRMHYLGLLWCWSQRCKKCHPDDGKHGPMLSPAVLVATEPFQERDLTCADIIRAAERRDRNTIQHYAFADLDRCDTFAANYGPCCVRMAVTKKGHEEAQQVFRLLDRIWNKAQ